MQRFILLHHHIFKNAGSSLDTALNRHFKDGFAEFHPQLDPNGRVTPQALVDYLECRPFIRALSSHHFFGREFEKSIPEKYIFFDCVMIRHPVLRLVSMYMYYRGIQGSDGPICEAAQNMTLVNFLKLLITRHPNFVVNPQVTMFGCDHYAVPPSPENYNRAMARLEKVDVLGTVDEYAKTMVIAEYFLQPVFPGLLLHSSKENVSNKACLPDYDGSIESIKSIVGESLVDQLVTMNDLDILLCEEVKEELNRRACYVPDFEARYIDFIQRC